jgi:hypothetical protein
MTILLAASYERSINTRRPPAVLDASQGCHKNTVAKIEIYRYRITGKQTKRIGYRVLIA